MQLDVNAQTLLPRESKSAQHLSHVAPPADFAICWSSSPGFQRVDQNRQLVSTFHPGHRLLEANPKLTALTRVCYCYIANKHMSCYRFLRVRNMLWLLQSRDDLFSVFKAIREQGSYPTSYSRTKLFTLEM